MATVSSLDKDLRHLRLDKYTPQRANEVRQWIESILGEQLPAGDLLAALKSGIALCKLVNMAIAPEKVRYKDSAMPFVQMENISHFLHACQNPPLALPPHDVFLTVDLYESKDPAQVLQCLEAFSRRAAGIAPAAFPNAIGGRKPTTSAPQAAASNSRRESSYTERSRGFSNASESSSASHNRSQSALKPNTTSPPGGSSWAKRGEIGSTAPAWNIAQYGWTGGASQGNQGITFGGRRQLAAPAPQVPNWSEKQKRRQEEEAEAARIKAEEEEAARQREIEEKEAAERQRRADEIRREEDTRRRREEERKAVEEEQRRWEEEERRWREEEELRMREEAEVDAQLEQEQQQQLQAQQRQDQQQTSRPDSAVRLHGQYLSEYKAEQRKSQQRTGGGGDDDRIQELERQLAEAKQREQRYEKERQERMQGITTSSTASTTSPGVATRATSGSTNGERSTSWRQGEDENFVSQSRQPVSQPAAYSSTVPTPAANSTTAPAATSLASPPSQTSAWQPATSPRPLPDLAAYRSPNTFSPSTGAPPATASSPTRSSPFARPRPSHSPSPAPTARSPLDGPESMMSAQGITSPHSTTSAAGMPSSNSAMSPSGMMSPHSAASPHSMTSPRSGTSPSKASSSLLEREMERERQRQREWEDSQRETASAAAEGRVDANAGSNPGQSWDVNSYGYIGGDNLNKSGSGVYSGRRQILGPRPMEKKGSGA